MAKLTVKQHKDINNKCKNGFVLDLNWFGIWGEKQLRKNITIDDYTVIDAYIKFGKIYAGRWSDKVVAVQPEIEIRIMTRNDPENPMYTVHNLVEENRKLLEWIQKILDTFGTCDSRERHIQIPVYKREIVPFSDNIMPFGEMKREYVEIPAITIVKMR